MGRKAQASGLIRGASPLGLPYTRSRAPLRRRAPFAWLARGARSRWTAIGVAVYWIAFRGASPLGLPYTLSRAPLRRRAPFAWLASLRSLAVLTSPLGLPYTSPRALADFSLPYSARS